jgi:transcriptional regulator with XRE-family HTH domain
MSARKYTELELKRKMGLKQRGITQADLAKAWQKSQPFVSRLLSGESRSRKYEEDLARRLDKTVEELFPVTRRSMRTDEGVVRTT